MGSSHTWSAAFRALAVIGSLCLVAAACGEGDGDDSAGGGATTSEAAEPLKIGVLYPFQVMDGGYAEANHEALFQAIEDLGVDKFEVREVENVPYTDQMTETVAQLFQDGMDVLIELNSSGPLFYAGCEQFPDKKCLTLYPAGNPPTTDLPPNTSGFYYDTPSLFYVQGVAAGELTETGTIGFVESFHAAYATSNLNAYALGCQSVRPDCVVRNVTLNSFNDPPKTIEAVNSLMDAGADVIAHYLDDTAVLTTAQEREGFAFGFYRPEQEEVAPAAWVTAANLRSGFLEVYRSELQAMLDGTWTPGRVVMSVYEAPFEERAPDGFEHIPGLELSPWGSEVPPEVVEAAEAVLADIAAGTNPFQGPINDDQGNEKVAAGDSLDRNLIGWTWDWTVEGVVGG